MSLYKTANILISLHNLSIGFYIIEIEVILSCIIFILYFYKYFNLKTQNVFQ